MRIHAEQADENKIHRQITAGAGTGKTERIARLIVEQLQAGVAPEQMVALTYGVQAARELKERIQTVAAQTMGQRPALSQMAVGTIHSVCLALLKQFVPRYASFRLLSEAQVFLLLKKHFRDLALGDVRLVDGPMTGETLTRSVYDLRALQDVLAVLREGDIDWSQVPRPLFESCQRFQALMRQERALDYPGLLRATVRALENTTDPDCLRLRAHIQTTVRAAFFDEHQDINFIQERLVQVFADLGAAVTVVGDGQQAIFGWRGCDAEYMRTFAQRYGARTERLDRNYRSSAAVLAAAARFSVEGGVLQAASPQASEPGDLSAARFPTPQAQAQSIVCRIQELLGTPFQDAAHSPPRGLSYSDMAVLCRSVRQSGAAIVAELEAAGIPYTVSGLGGLFAASEVQAVVTSFLFLSAQPRLVRERGRVVGRLVVTAEEVAQAWRAANLGFEEEAIVAAVAYLEEQRQCVLAGRGEEQREEAAC